MKFGADVVSLTANKADNDRVNYPAFEAADEMSAARMVADWEAARKYEEDGHSSWIEAKDGAPGIYLAFVGVGGHRHGGYVMNGVTIEVRLFPVK